MKKILFFIFMVAIFLATTMRAQGSNPPSSAISADSIIFIYPNPSHGAFTITFDGRVGQTVTVSIYNSLGTKIYESSKLITEIITDVNVNLQPNPPGMYCIHFFFLKDNKKEMVNKKIIIN